MITNIKILVVILFAIGQVYVVSAQTGSNRTSKNEVNTLPVERIFIHFNSTLFLAGETIYYKVYCFDPNYVASTLSKVAYVELIDQDKNTVFRHKLRLISGKGSSDFFVPATVKSGNYKLIGYTQWMRNNGVTTFFRGDVTIVNPFTNDQDAILENSDTLQVQEVADVNKSLVSEKKDDYLELKLKKDQYAKREYVKLELKTLKKDLSFGNYSLSVRKIPPVRIPERTSLLNNQKSNIKKQIKSRSEITYLPELRGELITGKILHKDSSLPAKNVKVSLSVPGKNYIFKVSNTNDLGEFYFSIDKAYSSDQAVLQVIESDKEKYTIQSSQYESINYDAIEFSRFKLTADYKDFLTQQSVSNQIENAYQNRRPDSIKEPGRLPSFFDAKATHYVLDDYTRFPTVKETIIEVVDQVYTTKKEGKNIMKVRGLDGLLSSTTTLPLVLVDGLYITDHDEIINFSANKVKKISFVSGKYFYSTKVFDGILSFETIAGDFESQTTIGEESYLKRLPLFKPQAEKKYHRQEYRSKEDQKRIPDFRTQLLWEPNISITKEEGTYSVYTSDVPGVYEIYLTGITNNGHRIELSKKFTVQ